MAPTIIPGVDISRLTGPLVLGYMWSYCLYGVLLVQTYMYTEMFPKDRRGLKVLVWVMFFFETLFTVLMTVAAWNMFGSGWGDPSVILQFNWTWGILPLLSGIHSGMAQGFYIWRIWHLTRQLWLPIPIGLGVFTQLFGLYWFAIKFNIAHWRIASLPPLSGAVTVWLVGSAACDVLITLSLTGILWRRILNRLIRLSIETGALTSVAAILEIILWLNWQQFYYHFIPFLVLGKLYSNVLMATLNCRSPLFLAGSQSHISAAASATLPAFANHQVQSAFWSEPAERGKVTGVKPAVQVSRNVYVDHSPDSIVMADFNIGSTPLGDVEKSPGKLE
ncbi:putative Transmembrane protein [Mycena sanguinolenta]|uniref:Putative Transmembrane protein n=1 Tax=Mycena sanguinolenta TaxID=230812 RepID=A0A8H6XJE4_9AGAR|nr:putative Transmembrane protein [Mycena sanguinolenta]